MRKILRVLCSRYLITAFVMLAELFVLCFFLLELSSYSVYFFVTAVIIDFLVMVAVINGESNPEYKLTWMAVVLLIPLFGAVLFIMFRKRKMSRREIRTLSMIKKELQYTSDGDCAIDGLARASRQALGKAHSILTGDECARVYSGSVSRYFSCGEEMYSSMLEDLTRAESFIFLEYFIICKGEMWDGIFGILRDKAMAGVEVRILYDDIGCINSLPRCFARELEAARIKAKKFGRVSSDIRNMHSNNKRDHRKLCIVDGRIGYTGGVNIADEYINKKERFGYWKDGGIRICGDAVRGFTRLFLSLWGLSDSRIEHFDRYLGDYSVGGDGGFYLPFGSGPRPMYPYQVGKRAFLDIINQAEGYVYITTPYLIVDFDLSEAMRGAALRGVDVRLITPGVADKKAVKIMTKSSYQSLMRSGVRIYEYTPGFIHSKTLVSDDLYAVVGTINLDYRSLVHHFEDGVWMYNTDTVMDIRRDFMNCIAVSHLMSDDEARLGIFEWALRCAVRLFAPLL